MLSLSTPSGPMWKKLDSVADKYHGGTVSLTNSHLIMTVNISCNFTSLFYTRSEVRVQSTLSSGQKVHLFTTLRDCESKQTYRKCLVSVTQNQAKQENPTCTPPESGNVCRPHHTMDTFIITQLH